jgi:hypothetical protein
MLVWPSKYGGSGRRGGRDGQRSRVAGDRPEWDAHPAVGEHVASVDRLIQESHEAIVRIRARVQPTDRRVQRTFRRIRDAAGAAQVAQRSADGADQRYLRAKQRELAAHERAIRRHDEAAELQQRFGHPDRGPAPVSTPSRPAICTSRRFASSMTGQAWRRPAGPDELERCSRS